MSEIEVSKRKSYLTTVKKITTLFALVMLIICVTQTVIEYAVHNNTLKAIYCYIGAVSMQINLLMLSKNND